jgi:hypothetical protein
MLSVENLNTKYLTRCRRAMTHNLQFQSLENCYGRPKARWREEVRKDARMLGMSWWSTALNREEWRRLLRDARTFTEMYSQ